MTDKLTSRQAAFVAEYLVDLNASAAARRAGYKQRSNEAGRHLLAVPKVAAAIAQAQAQRSQRTEVTADRVVAELARIAFSDLRDVAGWGPGGVKLRESSELTDEQAAQVAEVSETPSAAGPTVKVKRADKVRALELLGRHLGMFTDKLEHAGQGGGPLTVVIRKFGDD